MKIFVTIGSMFPMDRLIKEIDKIAENNKYEIIAQIGNSKYIAKNIKTEKFFSRKEFNKQIKWADLIICHGAIVTIMDIIIENKQIIIVPRQKKYGEAIDDHQLKIAPKLKDKYKINFVSNIKTLENEIKRRNKLKIKKPTVSKELITEINRIINN